MSELFNSLSAIIKITPLNDGAVFIMLTIWLVFVLWIARKA